MQAWLTTDVTPVSSLPFITADLPGIGGEIKAEPAHFVVEELPLYEPLGEGQHVYVRLIREGWTTRALQERLTDLFDLREVDVGCAGLKDKHARVTQTFSLLLRDVDEVLVPFPPGEAEAQRRLRAFVGGENPLIYRYAELRDRLDMDGTSRLSPYLRFGMISARQAVVGALDAIAAAPGAKAREGAETWLSELIWREFYVHICPTGSSTSPGRCLSNYRNRRATSSGRTTLCPS